MTQRNRQKGYRPYAESQAKEQEKGIGRSQKRPATRKAAADASFEKLAGLPKVEHYIDNLADSLDRHVVIGGADFT